MKVSGVELDLARMLKKKDGVVGTLTGGVADLFKKNKITRYSGHGRITGAGRVQVEGPKPEELTAKHILIATGSKPASLRGVTFDGDRIGTSTEALSYPEVPEHLVVIGAGYIGLELGSVWQRLGAKVTVLEFLDRILPGMDSEIAEEAERIFEKQGMEFRLDTGVTGARVEGNQVKVELGDKEPIVCDRVLVAVGRAADHRESGLGNRRHRARPRGRIPVDDHFRTYVDGHLRDRRRHPRPDARAQGGRGRPSPASSTSSPATAT